MKNLSIVAQHQYPLMAKYRVSPKGAWITDGAMTESIDLKDPFHSGVFIGENHKVPFAVGVHKAVGGLHDKPNPGDMLCGTLTACFDTTLRMIANRLGIGIKHLKVITTAEVDVRGTLMMDSSVPVAFQRMGLTISLQCDCEEKKAHVLLKATENSCIILQTLLKAVPISIHYDIQ